MDSNKLITIAREGNNLGQFPISSVRIGLGNGKFILSDNYWVSGMPTWQTLDQLPAEPTPQPSMPNALFENPVTPEAPPITQGTRVPQTKQTDFNLPTTMPMQPNQILAPPPLFPMPLDWRKTVSTILLTIGVIVFIYGLTTSPDGSAIRQQVLVQHMTNGLLFSIIALIVRKIK
jgi:hypothetical protein